MLTDEVLFLLTPTGGRCLADPSDSKNAAAIASRRSLVFLFIESTKPLRSVQGD
jgi:hypothetical protein